MDKIIVGKFIGNYLQALKEGGEQGVEARLKEIREETFKRMADQPNNSLTWKQICKRLNLCEKCGHAKHDEEDDDAGG
jgi:hypothetical protein